MNKLSYKIEKDVYIGSASDIPAFEIILDGKRTFYYFDVEQFAKSAEADGFYWMFEGACCVPGCCGVYAEVVHGQEHVIWRKFFIENCQEEHMSCEEMPGHDSIHRVQTFQVGQNTMLTPPLEFHRSKYRHLAHTLLKLRAKDQ